MRPLLGGLLATALLALPAAAAVDPRVFVLSQADAPRGYEFDESNSLLVTRAMLDQVPNDIGGRALAQAGFVSGYFARYTNYGPPHWRYVSSAAFVFREPKGARSYLGWVRRSQFAKGSGPPRRIGLGDEAWLYASTASETGTSIVWRYRNVVAWVSCSEMTNHRTLAVAQSRKQQRRIAAQLR